MELQAEKIRGLLEQVVNNKYCDFYRNLYKGVDITSWKNIPLISKKDIKEYEKKGRKFLFVNEDKIVNCAITSGTSNEILTVYLSKTDEEKRDEKIGISVRNNYSGDSRIMAVLPVKFPGMHLKVFERYMHVGGDIYDLNYSADLIAKLNINSIRTSPTIALKLGEILERMHYDKIRLIVLSGEFLSKLTKKQLEKKFPKADIFKLCGMTEFSNLGWQCKHLKGTEFYHTDPGFLRYEVLADTNEINECGVGELVVTSLWKDSAFPLIRYKTGDLAILKENNCECGSEGKILSLLGRIDFDIVGIAGITLHKRSIDNALLSLGMQIEDYQAHIHETEINGRVLPRIVLHIISKQRNNTEEIENKIMENFELTPNYNWKKAVEKGILGKIEIKFVNEIEEKGQKTLRVIDHRINKN